MIGAGLTITGLGERTTRGLRYYVDGLALTAPVMMVHIVALIVALKQAGTDQFRDRPTDIGATRSPQPSAHLGIDRDVCCPLIGGEPGGGCEVFPNPSCHRKPSWFASTDGAHRIAEPIADRDLLTVDPHERAGLPGLGARLRDQRQQHVVVARTLARRCEPVEEAGQVAWSLFDTNRSFRRSDGGEQVRLKHADIPPRQARIVNPGALPSSLERLGSTQRMGVSLAALCLEGKVSLAAL